MTNEENPVPVPALPSQEVSHVSLKLGDFLEVSRKLRDNEFVTEDEHRQYLAFKETVAGVEKQFQNGLAKLITQLQPFIQKIPVFAQQFTEWHAKYVSPLAKFVGEVTLALKELPPKLQTAVAALAQNGWFMGTLMDLPMIWEIEKLLKNGDVNAADAVLIEYFESQLDEIEAYLVEELPTRERILRAAFSAHRRGEFELSVPVFLTQADGACLDFTGFQFFGGTKAGAPPTAEHVAKQVGDDLASAMLGPLASINPINASPKYRNKIMAARSMTSWRELNRHMVFHGESVDYGTQVNSVKAISLLNYFVSVLGKSSK